MGQAEARWELVVDSIPDTTLFTLDEDLRIGLVAGAGAPASGLEHAEGRSLREHWSEDDVALVGALVDRVLSGETSAVDVVSAAEGREQEVVVTRLPEAEPAAVLVLAREVSQERRRAREAARERDRAALFFTEAPHGIAVVSPEGVVRRANPALCAILGVEEADLVGQRLDAWSENEVDESDEIDLDAFEENLIRSQARWRVRDARGELVHLAISSTWLPADGDDDGSVVMHLVDVTEQERYESRLAELALADALTGLPNRRRFEEELERHLEHCRRHGPRGGVLMVDLDRFKEVNDTLGHPAGDRLIISLGNVLRRRLRGTDLVARLGGDEYAVLVPDADAAALERIARDLVEEVRKEAATLEGPAQRVTASVGALLLDGTRTESTDVMSTVDMMLYDAKEAGRDRFAMLGGSDTAARPRTAARLEWSERIEQALASDGFELHLQPIVDVATGLVHGGELLVRMSSPEGPVAPVDFLAVAEQSNLVVRLDRWVLARSVPLLAQLQALDPDFHLEVNLSGRSVGEPSIEADLGQALADHDVDPRGLVLEITETAAVTHLEEARRFAERVSALGCRFALDDFGAGFGSFVYLKHLIFDYVKIDGEFVASCDSDPRDRILLASIVHVARGLGKQTIAEFVGSADVLRVLREEGVDYAQGHHVGRPEPVEDFVGRLQRTAAGALPLPA